MCFAYVIFSVHIFGGKYKNKPFIVSGIILSLFVASTFGELYLRSIGSDGTLILEIISSLIYIATVYFLTTNIKKIRLVFLTILFGCIIDLAYSYIATILPDAVFVKNITYIIIYTLIIIGLIHFTRSSKFNVLPEVIATVPKWITTLLILFVLVQFCKSDEIYEITVKVLEPFSSISFCWYVR